MRRHSLKALLKLLLVALLFATEALVLAHESTHALGTDSGSCFVCQHATPFKAAVPRSGALPPPVAAPDGRLPEPCTRRIAATAPDTLRARGPPSSPGVA